MRVIVTGCGRCGTSLMMLLLKIAGLRIVCDHEWSYEVDSYEGLETRLGGDDDEDVAVKVLDLHQERWVIEGKEGESVVVLMTRDVEEQVKSQMKFLRVVGFPMSSGRAHRRRMERANTEDNARIRVVAGHCRAFGEFIFDELITEPEATVGRLIEFFVRAGVLPPGLPKPFLLADMTAAIRKRSPKCYPGMMEFE